MNYLTHKNRVMQRIFFDLSFSGFEFDGRDFVSSFRGFFLWFLLGSTDGWCYGRSLELTDATEGGVES